MSHLVGADNTVIAIAVREYEAWFLAALDSLRSHSSILDDATFDTDPESPRNAKKQLEQRMTESYKETIHQPAFSALMDLAAARAASPSFNRFYHRLGETLRSFAERSQR